jgi:hypothetical protein
VRFCLFGFLTFQKKNNDSAPIFGVADLGVVGDVNAIIPKLIDEIARVKATKMVQ